MHRLSLRNIWLITKREYLERVRTKAFLIFTLLTPAIALSSALLPSFMINAKTGGDRHVVVVTSNQDFGSAIKERLTKPPEPAKSSDGSDQKDNARQDTIRDV